MSSRPLYWGPRPWTFSEPTLSSIVIFLRLWTLSPPPSQVTTVPQLCNAYQVRLFPGYAMHIKYACSPVMQYISSTIVPQLCNTYQVRLFPSYAMHIKYDCSPLCNTYQVRLFPSYAMHIKYDCSPVMQCISSTIVPQLCNTYQVRLFPIMQYISSTIVPQRKHDWSIYVPVLHTVTKVIKLPDFWTEATDLLILYAEVAFRNGQITQSKV